MGNVAQLLFNTLEKMTKDGSWQFGIVGGVTVAIPQWVYTGEWTMNHSVLIGVLFMVFCMEWLIGSRLAKKSTKRNKTSGMMIDSLIRDMVIMMICAMALGFDHLFSTGSVMFTIVTGAFIYHNFYSLLANIAVLGWEDHFPMWLLKWLDNEIIAKKQKYFPLDEEE